MRRAYLLLSAGTVAAGLAIHFHGAPLPITLRDILGDFLWAVLIFWILALIVPNVGRRWLILMAVAICFAVELSQLTTSQSLEAWRSTTLGHLTLGSDYDSRDLLAYSAGVIAAALIDRWAFRG